MFWVVACLIVGRLVAPRCRLQSSAPDWGSTLAYGAQSWRSFGVVAAQLEHCVYRQIVAFAMGETQ